jgi:hypothetical protein
MDLTHYIRPVASKTTEKHNDSGSRQLDELSSDAVRLLALLNPKLRMPRLPVAFPHIVNRLASVWLRPSEFERYIDELLLDTRGNRLGFPLEIVAELTALREHYQTKLHPKKSDPWSTVRVRS